MKICCYGDSNTYGFDPRGWLDDRYGPDSRWCDLLAGALSCPVVNLGENGRCIPGTRWEYEALAQALRREKPDLLVILLGSNDILMGRTPEDAAGDLEALLQALIRDFPHLPLFLLSPPDIRIPGQGLRENIRALAGHCQALADRYCRGYLCTQGLALAADGVHLSPEGHRTLARLLALELRDLP